MQQICDMGQTALLPLQGRHAVDFFARKIRRLRPGSNPLSWVPEASMLTEAANTRGSSDGKISLLHSRSRGTWFGYRTDIDTSNSNWIFSWLSRSHSDKLKDNSVTQIVTDPFCIQLNYLIIFSQFTLYILGDVKLIKIA
jgi:hypothetical protein